MRQSLYEVLIPHALEAFGDQAEADADKRKRAPRTSGGGYPFLNKPAVHVA